MERGWLERLQSGDVVLIDGGTGSELRRRGVPMSPEAWSGLAARDNEAVHSQFVREIWTATRLQAEFFIEAFVPEDQRLLYYVQDYLPVPTLKHFIAERPLDVPEAVGASEAA